MNAKDNVTPIHGAVPAPSPHARVNASELERMSELARRYESLTAIDPHAIDTDPVIVFECPEGLLHMPLRHESLSAMLRDLFAKRHIESIEEVEREAAEIGLCLTKPELHS